MLKNLSNREMKKIIFSYENSLRLPHDKFPKKILICPVGFVGAGKTTVLKPLSKKLFLLRISADEVRKLLRKFGYNYDRVKEILFKIAEKYIKQGFNISLDTNCAAKESQNQIKNLKRKFKLNVVWLHLNPPEKFIVNKLRRYKHTWLFKDANQAIRNYQRTKLLYKNLDFPFLYSFDPSRPDLSLQIKEAVSLLRRRFSS